MTTSSTSRTVTALLTGLTTAAYYAVPDVARSRAARGWLRTACVAAAVAVSAPQARDGWQELRRTWHDAPDGDAAPAADAGPDDATDRTFDGEPADAPDRTARPPRAVLVAGGVALLAASAVATVAAERWIYRRGEARAAAGVRFAHTRTGVVLGAASAVLALLEQREGFRPVVQIPSLG